MPDTNPQIKVPQTWVNLNTLSGYQVGTTLVLQNIGYPGDNISVALSNNQPEEDFRGILLNQINPMIHIGEPELPIWIRYYRFDNIDNYPERTGLLQVQNDIDLIVPFVKVLQTGNPDESPLTEETFVIAANRLLFAINSVERELKLLNLRFEENFDTGLGAEDL